MILIADPISTDKGHHFKYNLDIIDLFTRDNANIYFLSTEKINEFVKDSEAIVSDMILSSNQHNEKTLFKKAKTRLTFISNLVKVFRFAERIKSIHIVLTGIEEISLLVVLSIYSRKDKTLSIVLHNNIFNVTKSVLKRRALFNILKKVDYCIVHEEFQKEYLENLYRRQLPTSIHVVNPFVISKKSIMQEYSHPFVISFFGGDDPTYKGLRILMKAIELISPKTEDLLHIRIFGQVSQDTLSCFTIRPNVSIFDEYLDYEAYSTAIEQSHFVILPYLDDFQGRISGILYETIERGKPIIASDLDVFKILVKNERNAGFCFKRNDPYDLKRVLENITAIKAKDYKDLLCNVNELASEYSKENALSQVRRLLY